MAKPRLLLVDDEELFRNSAAKRLSAEGFAVSQCGTIQEAGALLSEGGVDLAIVDVRLPDGDGMELSRRILAESPSTALVVLTAYSSVDHAVMAIKQGAYDYLTKPVALEKLVLTIRRAAETVRLRHEVSGVRKDIKSRFGLETIVAKDPAMQRVVGLVQEIARSDARTILLRGESGSGKSLIARAIHYESPRQDAKFVQITCTTLQDALLESELFGHERGAFTDAKAAKPGLFEIADGGTVFLDEVSEMSERLQAKLLEVLDDQTFRRVGGVENIRVNVRLIAATNKNLELLVRQGKFREDLYYRLNVIPITVPPLRERREDIPELVARFMQHYSREFRKEIRELSPEALRTLVDHSWPGNVRELKNVVERAVLLAASGVLENGDIVIGSPLGDRGTFELPAGGIELEQVERSLIAQALAQAGGHLVRTAKLLGISKDTLRYRIKKYNLSRSAGRPVAL